MKQITVSGSVVEVEYKAMAQTAAERQGLGRSFAASWFTYVAEQIANVMTKVLHAHQLQHLMLKLDLFNPPHSQLGGKPISKAQLYKEPLPFVCLVHLEPCTLGVLEIVTFLGVLSSSHTMWQPSQITTSPTITALSLFN
ncbi:hypothetical protein LIER_26489 [Lithospermum erythrorhizon]|uniref:Uncharacterized protein n=1 Tax=Lithospermum erythrorhizon TaxID=34254 RepID=A0AAV3RA11_LITER